MEITTMVKISGESLKGNGSPFDFAKYLAFAKAIVEAKPDREHRILMTFDGGNVICVKDFTSVHDLGSKIDYAGMLASVQNCLLFKRALREFGTSAKIVVPDNFTLPETCHADEITYADRIVLFGGGIGVPDFSTDIAAAQNALAFGADQLFFLKNDVDGIYSPWLPDHRVHAMSYSEYVDRRLNIIDVEAIALLLGSEKMTIIARCTPENLQNLLREDYLHVSSTMLAD